MVVRDLLIRGLIAGLIAGGLAIGVAKVLGEPQVGRAIAFEDQQYKKENKPPEPVIVSRDVQSTLGLATGVLAIGTAFGGLFALAFAFAYGRIGHIGVRVTALLVAAAGFVAVYLVPFLKYPANPPSIGDPSTITYRTQLYFGMILISILLMIAAILVQRRLVLRFGGWNATLITALAFVVVVTLVYVVMPGINEIPDGFPAATLWKFRVASLTTQLTLWGSIGLIFGALTERRPAKRPRERLETVHR